MVRFTRSPRQLKEPLLRPLFNDMIECDELLETEDQERLPFARRTYFRTSFAYFDGHLHWLRSHVSLWLRRQAKHEQREAKLVLLDDEVFKPGQNGRLASERSRVPF